MYSPHFYPSVGGTEMVMRILAEEFTRQGHSVVVLSQTPAGDAPPLTVPVVRHPNLKTLIGWLRWCDLFFQGSVSLKGIVPLLLVPKPLAVTHQTWYRRLDGRIGWQDRLKYWVARRAINVAPSHAIAAKLAAPVTIIPNPYRDDLFVEMPTIPRDRDLIYVGRLVSDKGVDLLVSALARLRHRGIVPTLTIVGSGPEEVPLHQQASDLQVLDQIQFVGVQQEKALVQLLNAHRILVIPSRWQEPFGIVAPEGIACGCVVVGSAGGGLKDAIGACGVTFPNEDVTELTNQLAMLLTQPDRLAGYRSAAREHLARHTRAAVATAYLQTFEAAMGSRS